MLKFPRATILTLALLIATMMVVALATSAPANAGKLGLGTKATSKQIKAWDIDVRPDGQGLPNGHGSVADGERIFLVKCALCHGEFGEGSGRWPVLAGGADSLDSENPVKTVGSYWPYLSTAFDYIHRAMPFGDAQSLKPNETYAILAYLLNMNDIVEDDFVLSKKNFTSVKMPNADGFIDDPRPDARNIKKRKPCMKNCKKNVKITKRARIVDVTPDKEKNDATSPKID